MFTSSQRMHCQILERDVGCNFEFISPPSVEEVLGSSAEQVVATLGSVHPESVQFFMPTAKNLMEKQGVDAFAAALAQLSGFAQPPSSRPLITHEQLSNRDRAPWGGSRDRRGGGGSRSSWGGRSGGRNSDDEKTISWAVILWEGQAVVALEELVTPADKAATSHQVAPPRKAFDL
ncbi:hypothetical protein Leryth_011602 [Lithospermum erythrorhizon]|nr:hypothetical protein Leryth_011602 [Lithospermum erythrorhizon]